MKTKQSICSSTIEGTKAKRSICSSTIEGTKTKRSICSPTIEETKTKRSICSSNIEGTKRKWSIRSSTIEGTKTKRSIRSSTIDDLPLLQSRSPQLHFESLQLLNFKFSAEPDLEPAFHSNVDPDPAFRNDVDPHVSGFVTLILSRAEVESGLAYTENKENWVLLIQDKLNKVLLKLRISGICLVYWL